MELQHIKKSLGSIFDLGKNSDFKTNGLKGDKYFERKFTIDWQLIRNIGELQILKRISHLVLIIVPVVAALLSPLNKIVESFNLRILSSINTIDTAMANLTNNNLTHIDTEPIVGKISTLLDYLQDLQLEPATLPLTLSLSFFAALFITLGHLVYQLFAPKEIQNKNLSDFIQDTVTIYLKTPTYDHLRRAERYGDFSKLTDIFLFEELEWAENLLKKIHSSESYDLDSILKTETEIKLHLLRDIINDPNFFTSQQARNDLNTYLDTKFKSKSEVTQFSILTKIEKGAQAEYRYLARLNRIALYIALVSYALGFLSVAGITCYQISLIANML